MTKTQPALIEMGVIVAGPMDRVDARATKLAVEQADARLSEMFPEMTFDFFEINRPEMMTGGRVGQQSQLGSVAPRHNHDTPLEVTYQFLRKSLPRGGVRFCVRANL